MPDFGKLAVTLGFLMPEDLDRVLKLQADLHKIGVHLITKSLNVPVLKKG